MTNIPFPVPGSWFSAPKTHPVELFKYDGVKQVFFDSIPYKGKKTRVFACYGLPENASPEHPVPAVVLVHGGGATACADWVALWNKRGYAAISMDTCGSVPCWAPDPHFSQWPRHKFSGPSGWGGSMVNSFDPIEEQWLYHASAAVILSHSLLRSFPEVDPDRTGITGISWGGVISCLISGLDPRFKFAIPVYGCGFFDEPSSALNYEVPEMTQKIRERWHELWNPGIYLAHTKTPILFVSGINDFAFPPDAHQKSFDVVPHKQKYLSLQLGYPHNHTHCWWDETVFRFAYAVLSGKPVPVFKSMKLRDQVLSVKLEYNETGLEHGAKLRNAEFIYTRATGYWEDRGWNRIQVPLENGSLKMRLPRETAAACFNIYTEDNCCYSSSLFEVK